MQTMKQPMILNLAWCVILVSTCGKKTSLNEGGKYPEVTSTASPEPKGPNFHSTTPTTHQTIPEDIKGEEGLYQEMLGILRIANNPTDQATLITRRILSERKHYSQQLQQQTNATIEAQKKNTLLTAENYNVSAENDLLVKEVAFVMNRTMIEMLEKRLLKGIPEERPAEYKSLPKRVYKWMYKLDEESKKAPDETSIEFKIIFEHLENRNEYPKSHLDFAKCMASEYQDLCDDMHDIMLARLKGLRYNYSARVSKTCAPVVEIVMKIFETKEVKLFKN